VKVILAVISWRIRRHDLTWLKYDLGLLRGEPQMPESNSEQKGVQPKPFLGVHPAWALGVVVIIAAIAIFQLI